MRMLTRSNIPILRSQSHSHYQILYMKIWEDSLITLIAISSLGRQRSTQDSEASLFLNFKKSSITIKRLVMHSGIYLKQIVKQ